MLYALTASNWPNTTLRLVPLADNGANLCYCCGANTGESSDFFRGISISYGEQPNSSDDLYEVTTIQTRNGPVTVKIQHTWNGGCPDEYRSEDDF